MTERVASCLLDLAAARRQVQWTFYRLVQLRNIVSLLLTEQFLFPISPFHKDPKRSQPNVPSAPAGQLLRFARRAHLKTVN